METSNPTTGRWPRRRAAAFQADIIKLQHKMKSTREKWAGQKYDFYLIAHEHLYVFRKPAEGEKLSQYRHSVKWW